MEQKVTPSESQGQACPQWPSARAEGGHPPHHPGWMAANSFLGIQLHLLAQGLGELVKISALKRPIYSVPLAPLHDNRCSRFAGLVGRNVCTLASLPLTLSTLGSTYSMNCSRVGISTVNTTLLKEVLIFHDFTKLLEEESSYLVLLFSLAFVKGTERGFSGPCFSLPVLAFLFEEWQDLVFCSHE